MSDIVILQRGDCAALAPTQSGFAHGFGLFETLKLSAGRLYFWPAHWARLCRSADAFGLCLNVSAAEVLEAIRGLVEAEGMRDGVIKLSLLADGAASSPQQRPRPAQLFVYTRPALAATAGAARLQLSTASPINEGSVLAGHKTHNYMENILLLEAARAAGYTDVLRVNTAGLVAETTVGNLFFIEGQQLSTPALSTGILPGVMRAQVLEAAPALGVVVEEGAYLAEQLQHADAMFVTNAAVGILPVQALEAQDWRVELPSASHPLLQLLSEALTAAQAEHSIEL